MATRSFQRIRRLWSYLYQPIVARSIAVLALAYEFYYVFWRVANTLNPNNLVFSLVFLGAEVYVVVNFCLYVMMTWDVDALEPAAPQKGLRVVVFVPTYNEDLDILTATLTGCNGIRYPHVTYVLDDGRRGDVAALAARLHCRYLTRSDNAHAKAGNLNAALDKTDGEFVVILDADTVPQPDFLDRTLGYFRDPRVALVQLPQEFYNRDSVQHPHAFANWHEQALFYRVIQPGKNHWNAAFWCGSPSVVRRVALEDVGGVATETVTEDIHTSIRLHARGWKTVFHNQSLAFGIAPQTLVAFTVQRLRWAQGSMQLLRSRESPLLLPGLTFAQRLNYLASMLPYLDPFAKLVLLSTPAIILFTGWLPLRTTLPEFALHWVPYLALGALANAALGRGAFDYLATERYNLLKLFTFLRASTQFVRRQRLQFQVTPKTTDSDDRARDQRLLRPHVVVAVVEVLAAVVGIFHVLLQASQMAESDVLWIAVFWAVINAGLVGLVLATVARRTYRRKNYRFPVSLQASISSIGGKSTWGDVTDLSVDGVGVRQDNPCPRGHTAQVTLNLPAGDLTIPGQVVFCRRVGGDFHTGIRFGQLDDEERRRLITFLFVVLPRLDARQIERRDLEQPDRHARAGMPVSVRAPRIPSQAS